jgi:hypothetical protein
MSMRKLHINITLDKIQDTVHKKMKKEKKGELVMRLIMIHVTETRA